MTVILDLELLGMRIPAQIDMGMALVIHMCRLNYGEDLKPKVVNFIHAEPPCTAGHSGLFKAPVQFLADRDRMTLSSADVDKYLVGANSLLARLNDQVMIEYKKWTGNTPSEYRCPPVVHEKKS